LPPQCLGNPPLGSERVLSIGLALPPFTMGKRDSVRRMTKSKRGRIPKERAKKDDGEGTLAHVKKEMAKPRVAKSARKKYAKLDLPAELIEERKSSIRDTSEDL
jgi:hypothetical protein